jgi:ferric-dicitrate binding protein FerR (iron transport regulator)
MESEQQKLKGALAALKSGDKAAAWKLFAEILREDPNQADAWVGLSLSTNRLERRREYLERALRLKPNHPYARSALARLDNPVTSHPKSPLPVVAPNAKNPQTQRKWLEVYAGIGAVVLVLCLALAGLGYFVAQQGQAARVASLPIQTDPNQHVFIEFYADW